MLGMRPARTAKRYGFRLPEKQQQGRDWECLMVAYARYNGYWSTYHCGWAWCTLSQGPRCELKTHQLLVNNTFERLMKPFLTAYQYENCLTLTDLSLKS